MSDTVYIIVRKGKGGRILDVYSDVYASEEDAQAEVDRVNERTPKHHRYEVVPRNLIGTGPCLHLSIAPPCECEGDTCTCDFWVEPPCKCEAGECTCNYW